MWSVARNLRSDDPAVRSAHSGCAFATGYCRSLSSTDNISTHFPEETEEEMKTESWSGRHFLRSINAAIVATTVAGRIAVLHLAKAAPAAAGALRFGVQVVPQSNLA